MKGIALLIVLGLTLCIAEKYTDRYDDINIEEIIQNRRLLVPYMKCTLDQGRCTPEGKELKLHLSDAMQTGCEKCTKVQRKNARQVVKHIRKKEIEFWEQLKAKYDPKDQYKEIYERFLEGDD